MDHTEQKNEKVKKAIRIGLIVLLCVVLVAGMLLPCLYFFLPRSTPAYVAHRGYSQNYLGNTEDAFRAAAAMDFYGIETDVRKTKDGIYICHHDETVRLLDGTEKAPSEATFAELTSAPLKNDKSTEDVYICTFEKYLDICKSGNKVAVIELKEDFSTEDLQEILAIADARYDRKSIIVISFFYDALLRTRAEDPAIFLQYLSETKNDPIFDRCLKDGISIDVRQSILTKKMVKTFHQAGLTVNTWTINKKFDRSIVRIKGVDYVTTDLFDRS